MINMGKIKEGDIVHFRCKGEALVKGVQLDNGDYYLRFTPPSECTTDTVKYTKEGKSNIGWTGLLDIVKVTEKVFSWETDLVAGMAFLDNFDKLCYFCYFSDEGIPSFCCMDYECPQTQHDYHTFTRQPEKDIKTSTELKENQHARHR